MVSDPVELPFIPEYGTEYPYDKNFRVTWFEANFSQAHYKVHNASRGSNACTLIAVLMAAKCNKSKLMVNDPGESLNMRLILLLAESMLEGNKIHDYLKMKQLIKHINLNVPEAIKYAGPIAKTMVEWKSEIYTDLLSKSLYKNIMENWRVWRGRLYGYDLYVILVADSRTVVFIIQSKSDTVTLVDSHAHGPDKGAFIAVAKLRKLKHLCKWYSDVMYTHYHSEPQRYELSFLFFNK
ncbi:unnamed protein product [Acanthoscelides obtectus]|uniref:Uncharacterized protein n=1 Tax=Acanthoscelides obtectus TaxID=200917 RepID=A0A9P0PPJ5_ACAOB|nr:unnamed protein product [Acanthoscelides obtectus]CAK1664901.1 hypothetical protein AOBTE_LOCUS24539 [Acanthoscelides obtectus]